MDRKISENSGPTSPFCVLRARIIDLASSGRRRVCLWHTLLGRTSLRVVVACASWYALLGTACAAVRKLLALSAVSESVQTAGSGKRSSRSMVRANRGGAELR